MHITDKCNKCGACVLICDGIELVDNKLILPNNIKDPEALLEVCPQKAIEL